MNLGSSDQDSHLEWRPAPSWHRSYIPDIVKGDKRILLIGGKVVPFALARIPQNGEVRMNLAAGGVGVAQELVRDREIMKLWRRYYTNAACCW